MRRLVTSIGLCCFFATALAWAAEDKPAEKKATDKKFSYIDLQPKSNHKLKENFHTDNEGNNLASLPAGEQTLEGVKFKIGEGMIQLGSQMITDKPDKVEGIKVDKKCAKLHILHAAGYSTDDDTVVGEYTVNWEDGTSVTIPIVFGKDVRDWWYYEDTPEPSRSKVAWKGENEYAKSLNAKIRLYLTTWENPKPDKKIASIDYSTTKETPCAPFCVAMSAEEK
ncbi:MAG TPA: hypothetical protein VG099_17400 [Gemmataceae bacterium]|jgi:hypothetical protein|nr:hypothetical protein [Gemmataceae bacterium]